MPKNRFTAVSLGMILLLLLVFVLCFLFGCSSSAILLSSFGDAVSDGLLLLVLVVLDLGESTMAF